MSGLDLVGLLFFVVLVVGCLALVEGSRKREACVAPIEIRERLLQHPLQSNALCQKCTEVIYGVWDVRQRRFAGESSAHPQVVRVFWRNLENTAE